MIKRIAVALVLLAALATGALAQFTDQRTWGGTSTGSANAQAITIPNYTRHLPGVVLRFVPGFDSTAAATIAVTGLPPVALRVQTDVGLAALAGGELRAGRAAFIMYDGTFYQIVGVLASGSTVTKTGIYVAVSSDCGKKIRLGGSGFYTGTVGAPSGFAIPCSIEIENINTSRGRGINVSGVAPFTLWPGQTVTISGDGSAWNPNPGFQLWFKDATFYKNTISGSNDPLVSDGLAPGAGAFATFQRAEDVIKGQTFSNSGSSIQADCESTYDEHLSITGISANSHVILVSGNVSNSLLCGIQPTNGGVAVDVQDFGGLIIQGLTVGFRAPGPSGLGINCRQLAICDFFNIAFGSNGGATQINIVTGASASFAGTATIVGNSGVFANVGGGAVFEMGSLIITVPDPGRNVGIWFAAGDRAGIKTNGVPPTFTGGGVASVAGQQYSCSDNSVIRLGAITFPPSSSAGFSGTGCQAP